MYLKIDAGYPKTQETISKKLNPWSTDKPVYPCELNSCEVVSGFFVVVVVVGFFGVLSGSIDDN